MSMMSDHIAEIERSGTTDGLAVAGRPIVLLRMTRIRGGERAVPLMRVEHEGSWLAVASKGGAPEDPAWRADLHANPELTVQDGTEVHALRARELDGAERERWWERAVEAYPPYADYQLRTERVIPIYVLEPR